VAPYLLLEITFSTVTATEQHRGRAYYGYVVGEIRALDDEISAFDRAMVANYRSHLEALQALVESERRGTGRTDRTGCGRDCLKLRHRLVKAHEGFHELAMPVAPVAQYEDALAAMSAVKGRMVQLESKAAVYNAFAAAEDLPRKDALGIAKRVDRVTAKYFEKSPLFDRRTLHFNMVATELAMLTQLQFTDMSFLAALALACLPIFGGLALALLLRVMVHERSAAAELRAKLALQNSEKQLLHAAAENEKELASLRLVHDLWKGFKQNIPLVLGRVSRRGQRAAIND